MGQYETTTNTSQLIRWLMVCSAANLSGRPVRGHPSPPGAPQEPEGALLWLEKGWSHLLLTAPKLKPSLLRPVGGTLQSQLSICPCSEAKGCFPAAWICPLVPPQFILVRGPGGFHLDEHAGRRLGLCKRMSAWPSGCLVSKKIGSGLNQQGDENVQAVVRRVNFKAHAVQLLAQPGSAEGVSGSGTKIPCPTHLMNTALGD